MHTQSVLSDQSPWTDEAFANKKVMPGHVWRTGGWSLTVTKESFTLMVQWQAATHIARLPQLRRKIDKTSLEEASQ
eukprot:11930237-Karenia_brevis.AAC.1